MNQPSLDPLNPNRGESLAENMTLDALVKVVAYGVPALLIILGFFAYMAGYSINALAHDAGMMNAGIAMMAIGIILYAVELVVKVAIYFSEQNLY
jgi:hypothetical protein